MKLWELLDVIGAIYNDDIDLKYYELIAEARKEGGELYNVRGIWFDHKKRTISFSLTRSKRPRKSTKKG
jgi:hypothetical protein